MKQARRGHGFGDNACGDGFYSRAVSVLFPCFYGRLYYGCVWHKYFLFPVVSLQCLTIDEAFADDGIVLIELVECDRFESFFVVVEATLRNNQ